MTEPKFTPSPNWEHSQDWQTETLANGRFRVRIVREDPPSEPEHEGGCPIIQIDRDPFGATMTSYGKSTVYTDGLPRGADEIIEHFANQINSLSFASLVSDEAIDTFERYLRIFHDGNLVRYGPDNSTDYTYVAYITRTLWEAWGNSPKSEVGKADMDEWISYLEGDVWGIIPEKLTTWAELGDDGKPTGKTRETWEKTTPDDATWGYYGEDVVKQEAEELLAYWFSQ